MRKLIFIDNDLPKQSLPDSRTVQRRLSDDQSLTDAYISRMEVVSDFSRMDKDKAYKMLFDKKNAIVTYSMYTATHYNSLGQVFSFFAAAARSSLTGLVFIDGSGNFIEDIGGKLSGDKYCLHVMCVVENNLVISFVNRKWVRVRVKITDVYESPFTTEPVSLKDVLK